MRVNQRTVQQGELFPMLRKITFQGGGQARAFAGQFMEEIVCQALNLNPIPNVASYDVNFDARNHSNFYEIKSVREGRGKVPLYDFRMDKEAKAMSMGFSLVYCFALHQINHAKTSGGWWHQCQEKGLVLVLCPARLVHILARQETLQKIKTSKAKNGKRCGYTRKGYREGYRNLPVATVSSMTTTNDSTIAMKNGYSIPVSIQSVGPLKENLDGLERK